MSSAYVNHYDYSAVYTFQLGDGRCFRLTMNHYDYSAVHTLQLGDGQCFQLKINHYDFSAVYTSAWRWSVLSFK